MLNTRKLKTETVNGVTVSIQKQWMPDVSEQNCCYKILRSDRPETAGVCYMPGEADIYFNAAVEALRV